MLSLHDKGKISTILKMNLIRIYNPGKCVLLHWHITHRLKTFVREEYNLEHFSLNILNVISESSQNKVDHILLAFSRIALAGFFLYIMLQTSIMAIFRKQPDEFHFLYLFTITDGIHYFIQCLCMRNYGSFSL